TRRFQARRRRHEADDPATGVTLSVEGHEEAGGLELRRKLAEGGAEGLRGRGGTQEGESGRILGSQPFEEVAGGAGPAVGGSEGAERRDETVPGTVPTRLPDRPTRPSLAQGEPTSYPLGTAGEVDGQGILLRGFEVREAHRDPMRFLVRKNGE